MASIKNQMTPMGAASSALGLGQGDQLNEQVQAQIAQQRKDKMKKPQDQNGIYNPAGLSTAAMSLGLNAGVPK